jgi:hypothetical protein
LRVTFLPVGVADHPGEVADQEDHLVPEVLELPHLVEQHGVADVQVRGGRVEAGLDPQGRPSFSRASSSSRLRISSAPRPMVSSACCRSVMGGEGSEQARFCGLKVNGWLNNWNKKANLHKGLTHVFNSGYGTGRPI